MSCCPSGDHSSTVADSPWCPGSAMVRVAPPGVHTTTLAGAALRGIMAIAISRLSGDQLTRYPSYRLVAATIVPVRVVTTIPMLFGCTSGVVGPGCGFTVNVLAVIARRLPSRLGKTLSSTGVPVGDPSAWLTAAAVMIIRGGRP